MTLRASIAAVLFLLAVGGGAAAAEEQEVANDVARNIMSPYCPGVTLHDCSSREANALRERIIGWAEAGWDRDRILTTLEDEFGPGIRATPAASGSGLLAWLLPLAAVPAGALLAWLLAARWSRRDNARPPSQPRVSAEERAKLEAELDRMRSQT